MKCFFSQLQRLVCSNKINCHENGTKSFPCNGVIFELILIKELLRSSNNFNQNFDLVKPTRQTCAKNSSI